MTVLITKLSIKNPPVMRLNRMKVLADFELATAGIRVCHSKLVVNDQGYIVVWYPSVADGTKGAMRAVLVEDKALHRDITAAARAAYAAMGGTLLPYTEPQADTASDAEPADLPAFLTTRTPMES